MWYFFGIFEAIARCKHSPGAEEDAAEHAFNFSSSDNFEGASTTHCAAFEEEILCCKLFASSLERQNSITLLRSFIIFEIEI